MKRNTNWTSPKTNIIAGMNDLRKCLRSGYKARLVKEWNEKCDYPIIEKTKQNVENIENWKSSSSTLWSLDEIKESTSLSDDQKYMMINYCGVFGTDEAIKHYRETGELTADNLRGMGRWHIVKRQDVIDFLIKNDDADRAACFDLSNGGRHFIDNFHLKPEYSRTPKKFGKRLWVVEMLDKDQPAPKTPFLVQLISIVVYPLKWLPKKDVLKMKEYKNVTFRWGSVINGFSIEFHLPKRFSFN